MKNTVIILVVASAIVGIIVAKQNVKQKQSDPQDAASCPCSMLKAADTNESAAESADAE